MAQLSAIRAGLASALSGVSGLRAAYAVWPDNPTLPAMIVWPDGWDEHQNGGGLRTYRFRLALIAAPLGRGFDRAQMLLDSLIDGAGGQIVSAVESDPTLGGACSDLIVTGWQDYGDVEINGVLYLGVDCLVTVYA